MADHPELVAEIPKVEKLTVQERLEYAKRRRKQQLKRWEREKDSENGPPPRKKKLSSKPVTFRPQFMLLDAATRDDVDEGNGLKPRSVCQQNYYQIPLHILLCYLLFFTRVKLRLCLLIFQ